MKKKSGLLNSLVLLCIIFVQITGCTSLSSLSSQRKNSGLGDPLSGKMNSLAPARVEQTLVKGQTNKAEVSMKLGLPQAVVKTRRGDTFWWYQRSFNLSSPPNSKLPNGTGGEVGIPEMPPSALVGSQGVPSIKKNRRRIQKKSLLITFDRFDTVTGFRYLYTIYDEPTLEYSPRAQSISSGVMKQWDEEDERVRREFIDVFWFVEDKGDPEVWYGLRTIDISGKADNDWTDMLCFEWKETEE